jgi:hypothetical protein
MNIRITNKYAITCDDDNMRFDFTRLSDNYKVPSPLGGSPRTYPLMKEKFISKSDENVNDILDTIFTLYFNEDGYEARMVG